MHICLRFSRFGVGAHDELLRRFETSRRKTDESSRGPLELDMTEVEFFDPYGLCGLVLFLTHLPPEACPVSLKLPGWPGENPSKLFTPTVGYLTRMGFWDEVRPFLAHPPEAVPVRPAKVSDRSVLLEITRLTDHDQISSMLLKTGGILQNLSYTVAARGHILEVLSELCSNVLMHAQTDFGALAAMQTYRDREGRRYVVLGIGDHGIGVRASLAANQTFSARLDSDSQALGVAVQPGASRFSSGGHGGGLPRVLEIARRYQGRVAFRSGAGALVFHGTSDARKTFDAPHLQGTQLRIALPEAGMQDGPKSQ